MKLKYALHPKDYAIGQTEKFYTDMAAAGWHLKSHGMWFSEFVQGAPANMKYRVEVLNPQKSGWLTMPDEQKAVFEDCGWEYVDGFGYISILRAPADSDTAEFYIEPAQQAETLKSLKRSIYSNIVFFPLYLAIYRLSNTMMGQNLPAEIHLMCLQSPQVIAGIIAIVLTFTADSLYGSYQISKLYKQLKNGVPVNHSPKNTGKLATVIKYAVIVLGFVALYSPIFNKNTTVPAVSDGGYITLARLGYDIPTGNDRWLYTGGVTHTENIFCQYWGVSEDINKSEYDPLVWMDQNIYKLKNKNKTMKTAQALMDTSTFAQSAENFSEMEFYGLEKVYYNQDLELVVINNSYAGYFRSIFTEESRTALLTELAEKWQ